MSTPMQVYLALYEPARDKFRSIALGAAERFDRDMNRALDNYRAAAGPSASSPEARRLAQTRYDQAAEAAKSAYNAVYNAAYDEYRTAVQAARQTAWEGRS